MMSLSDLCYCSLQGVWARDYQHPGQQCRCHVAALRQVSDMALPLKRRPVRGVIAWGACVKRSAAHTKGPLLPSQQASSAMTAPGTRTTMRSALGTLAGASLFAHCVQPNYRIQPRSFSSMWYWLLEVVYPVHVLQDLWLCSDLRNWQPHSRTPAKQLLCVTCVVLHFSGYLYTLVHPCSFCSLKFGQ
jgi:hypothetical protein